MYRLNVFILHYYSIFILAEGKSTGGLGNKTSKQQPVPPQATQTPSSQIPSSQSSENTNSQTQIQTSSNSILSLSSSSTSTRRPAALAVQQAMIQVYLSLLFFYFCFQILFSFFVSQAISQLGRMKRASFPHINAGAGAYRNRAGDSYVFK
jgi:hypothetical protein